MVIEQIVEVPVNHRLTFEVPCEIPAGVRARLLLSFPPAASEVGGRQSAILRQERKVQDIEIINANAGRFNKETEENLEFQDLL